VLISNRPNSQATPDGRLVLRGSGGFPGEGDLTVTNNLGSAATVFLGPPIY
jgi:hypothetical protein